MSSYAISETFFRRCLNKSLGFAFGLVGDPGAFPSIMGENPKIDHFTDYDVFALRVLYSKDIKYKMNRDKALEIARGKIGEVR